ncbi:nitroreductase [Phascolarctobacterium succinatutens]|uniref:nitroreductase n=1 Tax=Phascolarctobacterium succinatutens TaxID=626940 RepID=UPI0026F0716E|nr:nitroreductase [Phascolarctobacterium succinatutens]
MNAELQALKERRSVRKYKADMVPQELIDQVIDAGLYAASGHGTQEVIIVAVTNKEVRDKLAQMNREILGTNSDSFYGAPVVLVVLGPKSNKLTPYDGSLVMGNMMQAAHAVGLGSCWINRAKEEFASEEGKQLLKEWGIEGEYEGVGHCILGYVDGSVPKAAPRKANRVFYVK